MEAKNTNSDWAVTLVHEPNKKPILLLTKNKEDGQYEMKSFNHGEKKELLEKIQNKHYFIPEVIQGENGFYMERFLDPKLEVYTRPKEITEA